MRTILPRRCSRILLEGLSALQKETLLFRPPLIILRQEKLADDIQRLCHLLDLKKPVKMTDDRRLAHANDYHGVPELSEKAKHNLRIWYAQDFEFYKRCCGWIRDNFDAIRVTG